LMTSFNITAATSTSTLALASASLYFMWTILVACQSHCICVCVQQAITTYIYKQHERPTERETEREREGEGQLVTQPDARPLISCQQFRINFSNFSKFPQVLFVATLKLVVVKFFAQLLIFNVLLPVLSWQPIHDSMLSMPH